MHDNSSETREGHLAQQHCENNGNILRQTSDFTFFLSENIQSFINLILCICFLSLE